MLRSLPLPPPFSLAPLHPRVHHCSNVADIKIAIPHEDWGLCMNGTRHDGSVKGAVWDFIKDKGLTVAVCYREPAVFRTWMVRKPSC